MPLRVIAAWGLCVGLLAAADQRSPDANPQAAVEAVQRVDQLGDPSFEARRTAAGRLTALGLGARDALISGLKHPDPHVRRQCRWILADVLALDYQQRLAAFLADTADAQPHGMPCWPKFKQLVGGDPEARKLFVEMLQAEGPLLETAAAGNAASETIAGALMLRCQNAAMRLSQMAGPDARGRQLSIGAIATILFILADPELRLPLPARENYFPMNCVQQPPFRTAVTDAKQTALKRLVGRWLVSPGSVNILVQRMHVAFQLQMPEAMDLARRFMSDPKLGNPQWRVQAMILVGRMGGKSHAAMLATLLDDTTEVTRTAGNQPPRPRVCQIRDVALAWLVYLTGEDFGLYGMSQAKNEFDQFMKSPQQLWFNFTNLGYEDPKVRDAAMTRWKSRVAQQPLDRLPEGPPPAQIEVINAQGMPMAARAMAAGPKQPVAGKAAPAPDGVKSRQADRRQVQALAMARDLCRLQRYTEGVRLLDDILAAGEDSVFQAKGPVAVWRGLKAEAGRVLAELPEEGRAEYRLQFDAVSRKMLDDAVRSGRPDAIAPVAERFFYTAAGAEAAYLEGLYWRDRGEPFRAALCLARLRNTSPDADRLEPLLSIELAGCSMRAGMGRQAQACLGRLAARMPQAAILLAGHQEPLPANADKAADWLRSLPGQGGQAEAQGWLMYQGDTARNASGDLGTPLVDSRAAITAVSTGPLCEKLEALRKERLEQRRLTIPDLCPLVVGKTAVIRSATHLAAFDLAASRLLWEAPAEDSLASYLRDKAAEARPLEGEAVSRGLKSRFWDDPNFGMPASDGHSVFLLENLYFGFGPGYQRIGVGPDGRRRIEGESVERNNLLCAYDLVTGKLQWEIGGPAGQDALPMAGTLFLGPPLPLAGRLYVLAEVDRQTRLLELDARTGGLLAAMTLGLSDPEPGTNQGFVIFNGMFAGMGGPQGLPRPSASPSSADGILVCQVAENQYAGLDLAGRNVRWIYQVAQQEDATPAAMRMNVFLMRQRAMLQDADEDRWLDAPPTIAEGRVLLTPRDSNELVCVRLVDGQPQWSSPRLDGLYLGGVQQGMALVVGRGHVWALGMTDGQPVWKDRIPLPEGQLPGGHGLLGQGRYYLPLSSGEIAVFDLPAGKLVARSRGTPQRLPGNLVACGDGVL
ncbi:MAG: PQQ-binding-like beta-propeller repeat protein, partial [Thermoguttaceae bacterium]